MSDQYGFDFDDEEFEPSGKYSGKDPEPTEKESGDAVERREQGKLKRRSAGHLVLYQYRDRERHTAYDASFMATGDYHSKRRESTRLFERGFLVHDGTLPNQADAGREHVQAFRINGSGMLELVRLGAET